MSPMLESESCTAFRGERRIASGSRQEVALAVKHAEDDGPPILAFDDATGRQIDFDLRGTDAEIVARLQDRSPARGPGRPKLGVVAREVTLLPRHWEWLAAQPGGPSGTLRRLVDSARSADGHAGSRAAADRFMQAMLGNQPGYEEASRALYAGSEERFRHHSEAWPRDLRDHARRLAAPGFQSPMPE